MSGMFTVVMGHFKSGTFSHETFCMCIIGSEDNSKHSVVTKYFKLLQFLSTLIMPKSMTRRRVSKQQK
jgi:hypothetical protein